MGPRILGRRLSSTFIDGGCLTACGVLPVLQITSRIEDEHIEKCRGGVGRNWGGCALDG